LSIVKRNSEIINGILWVVLSVLLLLISFGLPVYGISSDKINSKLTVDASIVNGILTATAIVFAFVAYELRENISNKYERLLLIALPIALLMFTVRLYVVDAIELGNPSTLTLNFAASTFFYVILFLISMVVSKEMVK
jgi:hypothetical protein